MLWRIQRERLTGVFPVCFGNRDVFLGFGEEFEACLKLGSGELRGEKIRRDQLLISVLERPAKKSLACMPCLSPEPTKGGRGV